MVMQSSVSKWGNSLGVRIPRSFAEEAGITDGSQVDLKIERDRIIIRRKRFSLNHLLTQVTSENIHKAVDTSHPVGREIW